MNILRITAKANPEKELELKQALKSALEKTSRFKDVKNCCYRNLFDENIVHVEQEWENSSSLQSYLNSKEFQYLIGAITVLGELVEQKIINAASVEEF
jgi:quinol monooxygenase YgiN